MTELNIAITRLELFKFSLLGIKFIREYCEGIKFAAKFVEPDAKMIKKRPKIVICKLLNFPIISVGLVKILSIF